MVDLPQTHSMYLVVKGIYTWGVTENWQLGIRLQPNWGFTAPDAISDLGGLDTDAAIISRSESIGSITCEWVLTHSGNLFQPDDYLNDQAGPAFLDHFGTAVANTVKIASLTLYPIMSTGKVVGRRKAILTYEGTQPQGIDSSHQLPTENAIAVSFVTAQVGPTGRGRVYSPPPGTSVVGTDGRLSHTARDDLATAWAALLSALAYDAPGRPTVAGWGVRPIVTGHPWDTGCTIQGVRVGDVIDTHESRRRSLVESYSDTVAPA